MEGVHTFPLPDGTRVRYEVLMIALEGEKDIDDMHSLEVSAFWLHEATASAEAILRVAVQRVSRYPPRKYGVECVEPGVVLDFNLPDQTDLLQVTACLFNADGATFLWRCLQDCLVQAEFPDQLLEPGILILALLSSRI